MPLTPEERTLRYRAYKKRYYEKNKAAILARTSAYQKAHPEQVRQSQKRWAERNKEKERLRVRAKNWRILGCKPTRPEPTHCECCGRKDFRALSLDHCHETGAFRGWLCGRCNLAIGKLGDTVAGVQQALDYLKRATQ